MFDTGIMSSAVDDLTAGIDTLLGPDTPLDRLGREEFLDVIRRVETQRRRLAALDQVLIAGVDGRGVAAEVGARNSNALIRGMLRLSPGEAAARVRAAKTCGPRMAMDGRPLEPLRPAVAAGQRAGVLSVEQSALITRVLDAVPAKIPADVVERVEVTLVEHARRFDPPALSTLARRILDTLDPDGRFADDAEHARQRRLTLRQNPDGSFDVRGRLLPECGVAWQSVLSSLAAPGTDTTRGTDASGAPVRDDRTPTQRRHDGFHEAAMRLLGGGGLPAAGGVTTTIVLTLSLDQLESRTGPVTTGSGGTLTVAQALRLAVDANVIPVVFTRTGAILAFGRTRRFATTGQAYAMYARDLRCTFPGCDQPASWCESDHAPPWTDGGRTDTDGMHLTCRAQSTRPASRLATDHDRRRPALATATLGRPGPDPTSQPSTRTHPTAPLKTPSPAQSSQSISSGSGVSVTPHRSRTPARISRARPSRSAVLAAPRLVSASVCLVDSVTGPVPWPLVP